MFAIQNKSRSRRAVLATVASALTLAGAVANAQSLDAAHSSVSDLLQIDRQRALDAERKSSGLPTQSELHQMQQAQIELERLRQEQAREQQAQQQRAPVPAPAPPRPSTKVYVNAIYGVGDALTVVAQIEDKRHVFSKGSRYAEGRPTNWRLAQVENNCIKVVLGRASRRACFEQPLNFGSDGAPRASAPGVLAEEGGIMQPPSPLM